MILLRSESGLLVLLLLLIAWLPASERALRSGWLGLAAVVFAAGAVSLSALLAVENNVNRD